MFNSLFAKNTNPTTEISDAEACEGFSACPDDGDENNAAKIPMTSFGLNAAIRWLENKIIDASCVENIAELRTIKTTSCVTVEYHTNVGDNGGGIFIYEEGSTAVDDNATVIAHCDTGNWVRQSSQIDCHNLHYYGVSEPAVLAAATYDITGDDNLPQLSRAIESSQNSNRGLKLSGSYFIDGDIDFDYGANENRKAAWRLEGCGPRVTRDVQFSTGDIGDTILMSEGSRIVNMTWGQRIDNISIFGSVQDGILVDAGVAPTSMGGFSMVTITNALDAPPTGAPVVLEVDGFFIGNTSDLVVYGMRDFRSRFRDLSINADDLFYSAIGVNFNTKGGGSGEVSRNLTVSGCKTGVKFGTDVGQSQGTYSHSNFNNLQCNYCNIGMEIAEGANHVTLNDAHFEFNTHADLITHKGAGTVIVNGGSTSLDRGGTAFKKLDAAFVAGNPNLADSEFKLLHIKEHQFRTTGNQNACVLVYGGADGVVLLENNIYRAGGARVIIDETNGPAHVWIRGLSVAHATDAPVTDTGFWISEFTRNGPHTLHSFTNAASKGRVEGVNVAINLGIGVPLDFTGRKVIPWSVSMATSTAPSTITLSAGVWIGQFMYIQKRFGQQDILIDIPAGVFFTDKNGTRTAGPNIVTGITGTGLSKLIKFSANEWFMR